MTSVKEYRIKISNSVKFCSRVVRRTIEGKIFTSTRKDSEHKEVEEDNLKIFQEAAKRKSLSPTGTKEGEWIQKWKENQEREKSRIR